MLKFASIIVAITTVFSVYADCEISESLKNKLCSPDYFIAKNSKQLNEYLQYGKFKDGKLLNLEIGFDVKDKEINIGTTCDLRLKLDADLRASQNGICLQGKNILIRRQSSLLADKKSPINLIADESIKLRKTNLQTSGDVNISTKLFNPFSNEILISRDSQISAGKLNINTPSSLIINDDSRIKSSSILLNGGNCEIGDNDDQDNDDGRDHERQCKKFKPKFTYTGTCLNNPIPTTLKISSVSDKTDSLKINYSIIGAPTTSSIKWKFDEETESSGSNAVQSFLFPGKHLAEAVVSSSNGYFRKLGLYNNISPTKFNKGQVAIFQFTNLKNGPAKVMGVSGFKKFTLVRSEQDPQLYSGEIPADTAGSKLIAIPEFGYKGNFNLVVLPAISNPDVYIGQSIDQLNTLLDSVNSTNQSYTNSKVSLQSLLDELKSKISLLSSSDKQKVAEYLQANIFADLQGVTSFKQIKERPITLFGLFIESAYAQDGSNLVSSILPKFTLSVSGKVFLGTIATVFGGIYAWNSAKTPLQRIIVGVAVSAAIIFLLTEIVKAQDLITDVHGLDPNSLSLKLPNQINSGEVATFSIWGQAIPLDSITPTSSLISQSIDAKNNANTQLGKINSQVSAINSNLALLGFSSQIEPLPLLNFPQTTFKTILSPNYVTSVQLISSDDGKASIQSYSMDGNNLLITFKSIKTQNAKIRVAFVNEDFGINKNIDTDIVITVGPKPVDSKIDVNQFGKSVYFTALISNESIYDFIYHWDFGDGTTEIGPELYSIQHRFYKKGDKIVTLTLEEKTTGKLRDPVQVTVYIEDPLPDPEFDISFPAPGIYSNYLYFFVSEYSSDPSFLDIVFEWDFGDGRPHLFGKPSNYAYHYNLPGEYIITLKITNPSGDSKSISHKIHLYPGPGEVYQIY